MAEAAAALSDIIADENRWLESNGPPRRADTKLSIPAISMAG
jgi:hypothetical protein